MKHQSTPSAASFSSPWVFFVLVLGWSWFFWIPTALLGQGPKSPITLAGFILGGLGPMVGGVCLTYLTTGKEGRRDYWLRVIDPGRIGTKWFLMIFLFVPILTALAVWINNVLGGSGATWEEAAVAIVRRPFTIIPFSLTLFFMGPFVEELGWRGYVLDRLQAKWHPLVSTLILGFVWAMWHLPLFFIRGTYQYALGAGSFSFWIFMMDIIPEAFGLTWIYNNTRRSTLAAMLFHFMINFTGELIAVTKSTDLYLSLLWIISAIGIAMKMIWNSRVIVGKQ
jgi:CAAX protease family protein